MGCRSLAFARWPRFTAATLLALGIVSYTGRDDGRARATQPPPTTKGADLALIVSVDVSESVDDQRYQLQMDGIAAALEDSSVIATITSGPAGGILFSMVVWADKSSVAVPWVPISTKEEATAVAARIRTLKRYGGEFTCMARMFANLQDEVIPSLPFRPKRIVVDVSGDGEDNCSPNPVTIQVRDNLVKTDVTINGLPIVEDPERIVGAGAYRAPGGAMENGRLLEQKEQLTLEGWYRTYVMGGESSFVIPANGYADFARAMRQKFVTEISSNGRSSQESGRQASASAARLDRAIARR